MAGDARSHGAGPEKGDASRPLDFFPRSRASVSSKLTLVLSRYSFRDPRLRRTGPPPIMQKIITVFHDISASASAHVYKLVPAAHFILAQH